MPRDNNGETSLQCASRGGCTENVELVVKYKASIDMLGNEGKSPLHDAQSDETSVESWC